MSVPVWLPGEGFLTDDGRFYSEDQVRALIKVVRRICDFVESLPPDVRAELEALHIESARQRAMERGS